MAQTITVNVNASVSGGTTGVPPFSLSPAALSAVTLSGTGSAMGLQIVGTSAENLAVGDVDLTSGGHLIIRNVDATNYVQLGRDNTGFVATARLRVGDPYQYFFIEPGITPQMKANTSPCKVEFYLWQA